MRTRFSEEVEAKCAFLDFRREEETESFFLAIWRRLDGCSFENLELGLRDRENRRSMIIQCIGRVVERWMDESRMD